MPAAGRDPQYIAPESAEITEALSSIDSLRAAVEAAKDQHPERWPVILQKLKILWTADSNAIEGSSLSFGDTKFFLETGLTVEGKPLKDFLDAQYHYEAINILYEIAGEERPVTEGVLKELNALILRGAESVPTVDRFGRSVEKHLRPGAYKEKPNSVLLRDGSLHDYLDPFLVPEYMGRLISWIEGEGAALHPALASAIAHYEFVRIHPFDDGNGRGARILMNLMLIRRGYPPCVIRREDRAEYLETLQKANEGNMEPFVRFVLSSLANTMKMMAEDFRPSASK